MGRLLASMVMHVNKRQKPNISFVFTGSNDSDHTESGSLKRKGGAKHESTARRAKQPAYFISELAHVVAMCDERLPFVGLASEVIHSTFIYQKNYY